MKIRFLCLLLLSIAKLHAATVLIDFGPSSTFAGLLPGKGPTTTPANWNNFTELTTSLALVDITGTSSGTITTSGAFNALNEAANPTTSPYPTTASGDSLFNNTARTLTLSGLNNSLTYNITLYGYINRTDSRLTSVNIGASTQTYEPGVTGNGNNGGSVTFSNLTPTAGSIAINLNSGVTGINYILSVMEITSVPEPGSAAISVAIGGLALLRRRRF